MIGNKLTKVYHVEKAARPFGQRLAVDPERAGLAFVWMMPFGVTKITPIPAPVLTEIVQAVDRGGMVVVHGDTAEAVDAVTALVSAFAGGGHA